MNNSHPSLRLLITEGLGYCCEWAFFNLYKRTGQIALRLGVSERAVRHRKQMFYDGQLRCEGCTKCMRGALYRAGKINDKRRNPR